MGALSADGSRRWNGQFWVVQRSAPAFSAPPRPVRPAPPPIDERRGFRPFAAMLAAVAGLVLGHLHFSLPASGSLESALSEMALANQLWFLFTYGVVVVILSVGRQGIDVLVVRAALVAFVLGAGFIGLTPLVIFTIPQWLLAAVLAGLVFAVVVGPVLALLAALANLLWYRSLASLRPQLRIFNRG